MAASDDFDQDDEFLVRKHAQLFTHTYEHDEGVGSRNLLPPKDQFQPAMVQLQEHKQSSCLAVYANTKYQQIKFSGDKTLALPVIETHKYLFISVGWGRNVTFLRFENTSKRDEWFRLLTGIQHKVPSRPHSENVQLPTKSKEKWGTSSDPIGASDGFHGVLEKQKQMNKQSNFVTEASPRKSGHDWSGTCCVKHHVFGKGEDAQQYDNVHHVNSEEDLRKEEILRKQSLQPHKDVYNYFHDVTSLQNLEEISSDSETEDPYTIISSDPEEEARHSGSLTKDEQQPVKEDFDDYDEVHSDSEARGNMQVDQTQFETHDYDDYDEVHPDNEQERSPLQVDETSLEHVEDDFEYAEVNTLSEMEESKSIEDAREFTLPSSEAEEKVPQHHGLSTVSTAPGIVTGDTAEPDYEDPSVLVSNNPGNANAVAKPSTGDKEGCADDVSIKIIGSGNTIITVRNRGKRRYSAEVRGNHNKLIFLPAESNIVRVKSTGAIVTVDKYVEELCVESWQKNSDVQNKMSKCVSKYDCKVEKVEIGSIVFHLSFSSAEGFKAFWADYKSGKVAKDFAQCFMGHGIEEQPDCEYRIQLDIPESLYEAILKALEPSESDGTTRTVQIEVNATPEEKKPSPMKKAGEPSCSKSPTPTSPLIKKKAVGSPSSPSAGRRLPPIPVSAGANPPHSPYVITKSVQPARPGSPTLPLATTNQTQFPEASASASTFSARNLPLPPIPGSAHPSLVNSRPATKATSATQKTTTKTPLSPSVGCKRTPSPTTTRGATARPSSPSTRAATDISPTLSPSDKLSLSSKSETSTFPSSKTTEAVPGPLATETTSLYPLVGHKLPTPPAHLPLTAKEMEKTNAPQSPSGINRRPPTLPSACSAALPQNKSVTTTSHSSAVRKLPTSLVPTTRATSREGAPTSPSTVRKCPPTPPKRSSATQLTATVVPLSPSGAAPVPLPGMVRETVGSPTPATLPKTGTREGADAPQSPSFLRKEPTVISSAAIAGVSTTVGEQQSSSGASSLPTTPTQDSLSVARKRPPPLAITTASGPASKPEFPVTTETATTTGAAANESVSDSVDKTNKVYDICNIERVAGNISTDSVVFGPPKLSDFKLNDDQICNPVEMFSKIGLDITDDDIRESEASDDRAAGSMNYIGIKLKRCDTIWFKFSKSEDLDNFFHAYRNVQRSEAAEGVQQESNRRRTIRANTMPFVASPRREQAAHSVCGTGERWSTETPSTQDESVVNPEPRELPTTNPKQTTHQTAHSTIEESDDNVNVVSK